MESYKIIKREENIISNWFGGKTTELFIYPPKSTFKKLDFDFRLSTATIEVEKSIFTPLPKVNRTLLLLDGALKLEHKNHHSIELQPFEIDQFEGGWDTVSYGKATDFNLMTRGACKGVLNVVHLEKETIFELPKDKDLTLLFLYKGEMTVSNKVLKEGDLLELKDKSNLCLTSNTKSTLIRIEIDLDAH